MRPWNLDSAHSRTAVRIRHLASATGTADPRQWGLDWNRELGFGGFMVGDEVAFTVDVEAVQPQPAEAVD